MFVISQQLSEPYRMGVQGLGQLPTLTPGEQAATAAGGAMVIGGAALYGAAIGGFSAGSWKGAGTGALLAGGVSGIAGGASLGIAGAWLPAWLMIGVGGAMLYFGGRRSYRAMKRGR